MRATSATYDVSTRDGLVAFYDDAFDAVYRCAAKLTRGNQAAAEDLTQEGFLRLTKAARDGSVVDVGVGWMITTVRRIHIDRLRSKDREARRVHLVSNGERERDALPAPQNSGGYLMDGLNDREQTALVLRYVEDLPVGEIAALMGVSTQAAQSLLQRAKGKARTRRNSQ